MAECLVYLFTGFLESGKTTLIQETLKDDGFNTGDEKTLILLCEEGEVCYTKRLAEQVHATVVSVNDPKKLTAPFLAKCEQLFHPDRVMIEYNGMWSVDQFLDVELPLRWILVQILSTVDASTFAMYLANMRSILYEQLRHSETIIFNRCDSSTDMLYLRNNIKAMNKRAQLIYESREGTILSAQEEQLPFDVSADHIELQDYDYGIWYMDALEHPRKYEGKTIAYNVKVYPVDLYKSNAYVAGREAMVCCSDDTSLIGLWVYTKQLKPKALSWIHLYGRIRVEFDEDYGGEVCVIDEIERTELQEHEDDYVYFT
ncbi:MAG: GTP-binding protein [Merdibacter sp.]|nr:GTP-binding protein [Merdibacter sp.]